jgi:hypothetical protein
LVHPRAQLLVDTLVVRPRQPERSWWAIFFGQESPWALAQSTS